MNHAFEDIEVKANVPQLLEQALRHKRQRCMIGTGAMSAPYLPLEKERRLTRKCLEFESNQLFEYMHIFEDRETGEQLSLF